MLSLLVLGAHRDEEPERGNDLGMTRKYERLTKGCFEGVTFNI
jgi:hypothetical protein